jgi:hypothetical protein
VPPRSAIVGRNTYSQNLYDPPSVVTYAATLRLAQRARALEKCEICHGRRVDHGSAVHHRRRDPHDVASALTGFQIANAGSTA